MLDAIRNACAKVCAAARYVHINRDRLEDYAASLPVQHPGGPNRDECDQFFGSIDATVAFILTLDAINFGSGYFPHLQKRDHLSGYFTIASYLRDYFAANGPLSSTRLRALSEIDCGEIFRQDLRDPLRRELMTLFARALNDFGTFLQDFADDYVQVVQSADKSSAQLVATLIKMPLFRDVALYDGFDVPFYKRAQITVADLAIRLGFEGCGEFHDLDQLTIFADNVVPNVFRVDGILTYDRELATRIDAGSPIAAGSREEIEIRAAAVHTAELLVELIRRRDNTVTAMALDYVLWNRGRGASYKRSARHRTRTAFY